MIDFLNIRPRVTAKNVIMALENKALIGISNNAMMLGLAWDGEAIKTSIISSTQQFQNENMYSFLMKFNHLYRVYLR